MTAPKKDLRFRNATFLVYADSAPENWIDLLRVVEMAKVSQHTTQVLNLLNKLTGTEIGKLLEVRKRFIAIATHSNMPMGFFRNTDQLASL